MDLDGKKIVIIGGSSGMGLATAAAGGSVTRRGARGLRPGDAPALRARSSR